MVFSRSPQTPKVNTGEFKCKIPFCSGFKQNHVADFDYFSDVKQELFCFVFFSGPPAELLLRCELKTSKCNRQN